jgi:hypothetical protein
MHTPLALAARVGGRRIPAPAQPSRVRIELVEYTVWIESITKIMAGRFHVREAFLQLLASTDTTREPSSPSRRARSATWRRFPHHVHSVQASAATSPAPAAAAR